MNGVDKESTARFSMAGTLTERVGDSLLGALWWQECDVTLASPEKGLGEAGRRKKSEGIDDEDMKRSSQQTSPVVE